MNNINFDMNAIFKMNDISNKTQNHLSKVYSILGSGIITSLIFGYISSYGLINQYLIYTVLVLTSIAEIVLFFTRYSKFSKQYLSPITYYALTSAVGAALGLVFSSQMTSNLSKSDIIMLKSVFLTAGVYTSGIFVSISIFALLTVRRMIIFYGCIISSFILSILSIFIINASLYSIFGLIIGVLFVIVDTQIMIQKAERGIFEPFDDARQLYHNLVQLFIKIVQILMKDKKEKKDE